MNISSSPPPIYEKAKKAFGLDFVKDGLVMTYGDTVHVATGALPRDLVPHEQTHISQQTTYEGGPDAWWERYLTDPDWRLQQELQAYRKQWKWLERNERDSKKRTELLLHCAKSLSSSIYGSIITMDDALRRIKQ